MATLTPFTKEDWYGLAGAEPFANGDEPLVCYDVKVDDLDAMVVLDANGLMIQVLTPDGETVSTGELSGMAAARFAANLQDSYDTGSLIDAGFIFEVTN